MGCDIHMFVEFKSYVTQQGEQTWECFGGQYNPGRDYKMFGALAGVRDGDVECPYPMRGLPEGRLSFDAQHEMGEGAGDLHSHSWLTADEYAHVYGIRMLACEWGPPSIGYELILVLLQTLKERGLDGRVVFAFDN
jgi:hypothetical protein